MMVDIGNPQNCYECLIRNQGYSGIGMKCGKTGSVISWYYGNRQRMASCPPKEVKNTVRKDIHAYWIDSTFGYQCSFCYSDSHDRWNYCPRCGVTMK